MLSILILFIFFVAIGFYFKVKEKINRRQSEVFKKYVSEVEKRMGIRKIVTGDFEFLHKKSKDVVEFDSKLENLIDDMIETLHSREGAIGLAAPQVGILRRVVVIDIGEGVVELVNPSIVEEKGEQIEMEGCLSFPDQYEKVKRPSYVKVKAYDRKGKEFFMDGEGLLARAFCHEIDHLNGIVFLDKVYKETK